MIEANDLDKWVREAIGNVDPGSREVLATLMRRFIVCDLLLAVLADVPSFGWSEWQELERSATKEKNRDRRAELEGTRDQIAAERAGHAANVRDAMRIHRDLLRVVQSEHGGGGRLRSQSPARHRRRGWFRRPPATALDALEECPIVGVECVEAVRTVFMEARDDLQMDLNSALRDLLPVTHRLRQRAVVEALDPELYTQDGALRETARRILRALDTPAKAWKNVETRAELSLDEVKRYSQVLQRAKLVARDPTLGWVRTDAGTKALGSTSKPVGPP
jgi:hypothetical protein